PPLRFQPMITLAGLSPGTERSARMYHYRLTATTGTVCGYAYSFGTPLFGTSLSKHAPHVCIIYFYIIQRETRKIFGNSL
ncbi:MAG: hypothetical protein LBK44_02145, partial [Spirochaetales bacterium]|nr:hypothetical protein [Spirochaetales bacterium]